MATIVKEKRREKKKSKDKSISRSNIESKVSLAADINFPEDINSITTLKFQTSENEGESCISSIENLDVGSTELSARCQDDTIGNQDISLNKNVFRETSEDIPVSANTSKIKVDDTLGINRSHTELETLCIPLLDSNEKEFSNSSNITIQSEATESQNITTEAISTDVVPSAPVLEVQYEEQPQVTCENITVKEYKPKVLCIPLEEAIKLFGGTEMEAVRAMSEREEALVEAGPVSGPEHPLVDLLSTFRSSLIAVESERTKLACGFAEEEKFRSTLWKIEKRTINLSEICSCGSNVDLKATYQHAELLKERLPAARLKLEGLLRDIQESYCHHQHSALLAHCQIEELISEIAQGSKGDIRESLSLVLQALRLSDGAPEALPSALQRWASVLAAALVDTRDLRQLLFLLHHLFRQTRSVQWASRVVQLRVSDSVSAARVIALLDILLARPRLDLAVECTEDSEEAWEEVGKRGEGGAVSEGALRERDLLALLRALPRRDLLATLALFTHADIRAAREHEWGDRTGGREAARACCGVRALLGVLQRATHAHAPYARLLRALRALAARALRLLACLYQSPRVPYTQDMEAKLEVEMEAAFVGGFVLFGAHDLHKLPATLLSDSTAKDYCVTLMLGLHDTSPRRIESLGVEMPVVGCDVRVRSAAQAAADRAHDRDLARIVLEFLFQTGIKRKTVLCKGSCDVAARESIPRLLAAHPYVHTVGLYILAELNQAEALEAGAVRAAHARAWRPCGHDARALLAEWARRCPHLLPHLLLHLDYTPHVGVSLESQLSIGEWLCEWVREAGAGGAGGGAGEWAWRVLRRLRPHRACWGLSLDAPAPHHDPEDLFSTAYAILSSSWGHCIPLICSAGVSALCTLAGARAADAAHCLAPVMLVMAHSPESIALTPKFAELFDVLLSSGPSLVQRALGRGPEAGPALLLRLMLHQFQEGQAGSPARTALVSAWLHALWRAGPPAAAALDAAALAAREWRTLHAHAEQLLKEENSKELISEAVRNASIAPLLCECVLRAGAQAQARGGALGPRLALALCRQRAAGHKIHVDNALQELGVTMKSEELVMYRSSAGALVAPPRHPAHLALWTLFLHLYLQRPPDDTHETGPPVGPLFFSGIMKSRTLVSIKKRLQESAAYHHGEAETLKNLQNSQEGSETPSSSKTIASKSDDSLLPALSIVDLTGESSESSESSDESDSLSEEEVVKDIKGEADSEIKNKDTFNLLCYHVAAEKMLREYCGWLEEGERVRAVPRLADMARFVPDQALEAAWSHTLSRLRPPPDPELEFPRAAPPPHPPPHPPPPPPSPPSPFHVAVTTLLEIKDRSNKRSPKRIISPLEDVDFRDSRTLLALVDKHLRDIERLSQEWSTEVNRISSLDSKLWELVTGLRVRRAVPPVRKRCANNKCKPLLFHIPVQEWCISTGAERGIKENRRSAVASVRRLARARPHAARTVAALHSIARRIGTSEAAVRVCERAGRSAGAGTCAACPAAHEAVVALVTHLADRWICDDGRLCAELVARWCGGGGGGGGAGGGEAVRGALCGALVRPRRVRADAWPLLYVAILTANLPPHSIFSYLSRFEMSRWAETADPGQRRELLEALSDAVERWGSAPDPQQQMVVELAGVHTAALVRAGELRAALLRAARAALRGALPPAHWPHLCAAAHRTAPHLSFDQLGHLLRELGEIWWEDRTGGAHAHAHAHWAALAPHAAALLHVLLRAFVAAALALSYQPERVSWYAWGALQEAWGAWVRPLPSPPPAGAPALMLRHFLDAIHQIMLDCPGSEVHLLQQAFEWTVQAYLGVLSPPASQESRAHAAALLAELARLPWDEHQWCYGTCLGVALQVCTVADKELAAWCCVAWRRTAAGTWARGEASHSPESLAPRLAHLLYLFTGTAMPHALETLEEATRLPWWELPEPPLDEALQRFFAVHHDPTVAYHDLPQFSVILSASEMRPSPGPACGARAQARYKRASCVSRWAHAASAPALRPHVRAHSAAILSALTDLAPHVEDSDGEIEELLGRASIIMCMEPAAADALPVWEKWVSATTARMVRACVSAAAALTALEYCAAISDAAARALLATDEGGWADIRERWATSPWRGAAAPAARARLHAAYACALAHAAAAHASTAAALLALQGAQINFVADEVIVAVWICYACRVARECSGARESVYERASVAAERAESASAAGALLARWAQPPRRSILRVVTLHADTDRPTAQHRVLCRLAECILSPESESAARAYEAACGAAGAGAGAGAAGAGAAGDVSAWGRTPRPRTLPRLAARLYPSYERYFQYELNMAPDETG